MSATTAIEPNFAPGVLDLLCGRDFLNSFREHVALVHAHFPEMRCLNVCAIVDPDIPGRHWVELEVTVPPQVHADVVRRRRAAVKEMLDRFPDRMVIAITLRVNDGPE
jgi:hypothetical protein